MSLSEAQDWAIRGFFHYKGRMTAQQVGLWMTYRPGLNTTNKVYSNFTLGRMGGGMIANLAKSGMVRPRKIGNIRFASWTEAGKLYCAPPDERLPEDLQEFLKEFM